MSGRGVLMAALAAVAAFLAATAVAERGPPATQMEEYAGPIVRIGQGAKFAQHMKDEFGEAPAVVGNCKEAELGMLVVRIPPPAAVGQATQASPREDHDRDGSWDIAMRLAGTAKVQLRQLVSVGLLPPQQEADVRGEQAGESADGESGSGEESLLQAQAGRRRRPLDPDSGSTGDQDEQNESQVSDGSTGPPPAQSQDGQGGGSLDSSSEGGTDDEGDATSGDGGRGSGTSEGSDVGSPQSDSSQGRESQERSADVELAVDESQSPLRLDPGVVAQPGLVVKVVGTDGSQSQVCGWVSIAMPATLSVRSEPELLFSYTSDFKTSSRVVADMTPPEQAGSHGTGPVAGSQGGGDGQEAECGGQSDSVYCLGGLQRCVPRDADRHALLLSDPAAKCPEDESQPCRLGKGDHSVSLAQPVKGLAAWIDQAQSLAAEIHSIAEGEHGDGKAAPLAALLEEVEGASEYPEWLRTIAQVMMPVSGLRGDDAHASNMLSILGEREEQAEVDHRLASVLKAFGSEERIDLDVVRDAAALLEQALPGRAVFPPPAAEGSIAPEPSGIALVIKTARGDATRREVGPSALPPKRATPTHLQSIVAEKMVGISERLAAAKSELAKLGEEVNSGDSVQCPDVQTAIAAIDALQPEGDGPELGTSMQVMLQASRAAYTCHHGPAKKRFAAIKAAGVSQAEADFARLLESAASPSEDLTSKVQALNGMIIKGQDVRLEDRINRLVFSALDRLISEHPDAEPTIDRAAVERTVRTSIQGVDRREQKEWEEELKKVLGIQHKGDKQLTQAQTAKGTAGRVFVCPLAAPLDDIASAHECGALCSGAVYDAAQPLADAGLSGIRMSLDLSASFKSGEGALPLFMQSVCAVPYICGEDHSVRLRLFEVLPTESASPDFAGMSTRTQAAEAVFCSPKDDSGVTARSAPRFGEVKLDLTVQASKSSAVMADDIWELASNGQSTSHALSMSSRSGLVSLPLRWPSLGDNLDESGKRVLFDGAALLGVSEATALRQSRTAGHQVVRIGGRCTLTDTNCELVRKHAIEALSRAAQLAKDVGGSPAIQPHGVCRAIESGGVSSQGHGQPTQDVDEDGVDVSGLEDEDNTDDEVAQGLSSEAPPRSLLQRGGRGAAVRPGRRRRRREDGDDESSGSQVSDSEDEAPSSQAQGSGDSEVQETQQDEASTRRPALNTALPVTSPSTMGCHDGELVRVPTSDGRALRVLARVAASVTSQLDPIAFARRMTDFSDETVCAEFAICIRGVLGSPLHPSGDDSGHGLDQETQDSEEDEDAEHPSSLLQLASGASRNDGKGFLANMPRKTTPIDFHGIVQRFASSPAFLERPTPVELNTLHPRTYRLVVRLSKSVKTEDALACPAELNEEDVDSILGTFALDADFGLVPLHRADEGLDAFAETSTAFSDEQAQHRADLIAKATSETLMRGLDTDEPLANDLEAFPEDAKTVKLVGRVLRAVRGPAWRPPPLPSVEIPPTSENLPWAAEQPSAACGLCNPFGGASHHHLELFSAGEGEEATGVVVNFPEGADLVPPSRIGSDADCMVRLVAGLAHEPEHDDQHCPQRGVPLIPLKKEHRARLDVDATMCVTASACSAAAHDGLMAATFGKHARVALLHVFATGKSAKQRAESDGFAESLRSSTQVLPDRCEITKGSFQGVIPILLKTGLEDVPLPRVQGALRKWATEDILELQVPVAAESNIFIRPVSMKIPPPLLSKGGSPGEGVQTEAEWAKELVEAGKQRLSDSLKQALEAELRLLEPAPPEACMCNVWELPPLDPANWDAPGTAVNVVCDLCSRAQAMAHHVLEQFEPQVVNGEAIGSYGVMLQGPAAAGLSRLLAMGAHEGRPPLVGMPALQGAEAVVELSELAPTTMYCAIVTMCSSAQADHEEHMSSGSPLRNPQFDAPELRRVPILHLFKLAGEPGLPLVGVPDKCVADPAHFAASLPVTKPGQRLPEALEDLEDGLLTFAVPTVLPESEATISRVQHVHFRVPLSEQAACEGGDSWADLAGKAYKRLRGALMAEGSAPIALQPPPAMCPSQSPPPPGWEGFPNDDSPFSAACQFCESSDFAHYGEPHHEQMGSRDGQPGSNQYGHGAMVSLPGSVTLDLSHGRGSPFEPAHETGMLADRLAALHSPPQSTEQPDGDEEEDPAERDASSTGSQEAQSPQQQHTAEGQDTVGDEQQEQQQQQQVTDEAVSLLQAAASDSVTVCMLFTACAPASASAIAKHSTSPVLLAHVFSVDRTPPADFKVARCKAAPADFLGLMRITNVGSIASTSVSLKVDQMLEEGSSNTVEMTLANPKQCFGTEGEVPEACAHVAEDAEQAMSWLAALADRVISHVPPLPAAAPLPPMSCSANLHCPDRGAPQPAETSWWSKRRTAGCHACWPELAKIDDVTPSNPRMAHMEVGTFRSGRLMEHVACDDRPQPGDSLSAPLGGSDIVSTEHAHKQGGGALVHIDAGPSDASASVVLKPEDWDDVAMLPALLDLRIEQGAATLHSVSHADGSGADKAAPGLFCVAVTRCAEAADGQNEKAIGIVHLFKHLYGEGLGDPESCTTNPEAFIGLMAITSAPEALGEAATPSFTASAPGGATVTFSAATQGDAPGNGWYNAAFRGLKRVFDALGEAARDSSVLDGEVTPPSPGVCQSQADIVHEDIQRSASDMCSVCTPGAGSEDGIEIEGMEGAYTMHVPLSEESLAGVLMHATVGEERHSVCMIPTICLTAPSGGEPGSAKLILQATLSIQSLDPLVKHGPQKCNSFPTSEASLLQAGGRRLQDKHGSVESGGFGFRFAGIKASTSKDLRFDMPLEESRVEMLEAMADGQPAEDEEGLWELPGLNVADHDREDDADSATLRPAFVLPGNKILRGRGNVRERTAWNDGISEQLRELARAARLALQQVSERSEGGEAGWLPSDSPAPPEGCPSNIVPAAVADSEESANWAESSALAACGACNFFVSGRESSLQAKHLQLAGFSGDVALPSLQDRMVRLGVAQLGSHQAPKPSASRSLRGVLVDVGARAGDIPILPHSLLQGEEVTAGGDHTPSYWRSALLSTMGDTQGLALGSLKEAVELLGHSEETGSYLPDLFCVVASICEERDTSASPDAAPVEMVLLRWFARGSKQPLGDPEHCRVSEESFLGVSASPRTSGRALHAQSLHVGFVSSGSAHVPVDLLAPLRGTTPALESEHPSEPRWFDLCVRGLARLAAAFGVEESSALPEGTTVSLGTTSDVLELGPSRCPLNELAGAGDAEGGKWWDPDAVCSACQPSGVEKVSHHLLDISDDGEYGVALGKEGDQEALVCVGLSLCMRFDAEELAATATLLVHEFAIAEAGSFGRSTGQPNACKIKKDSYVATTKLPFAASFHESLEQAARGQHTPVLGSYLLPWRSNDDMAGSAADWNALVAAAARRLTDSVAGILDGDDVRPVSADGLGSDSVPPPLACPSNLEKSSHEADERMYGEELASSGTVLEWKGALPEACGVCESEGPTAQVALSEFPAEGAKAGRGMLVSVAADSELHALIPTAALERDPDSEPVRFGSEVPDLGPIAFPEHATPSLVCVVVSACLDNGDKASGTASVTAMARFFSRPRNHLGWPLGCHAPAERLLGVVPIDVKATEAIRGSQAKDAITLVVAGGKDAHLVLEAATRGVAESSTTGASWLKASHDALATILGAVSEAHALVSKLQSGTDAKSAFESEQLLCSGRAVLPGTPWFKDEEYASCSTCEADGKQAHYFLPGFNPGHSDESTGILVVIGDSPSDSSGLVCMAVSACLKADKLYGKGEAASRFHLFTVEEPLRTIPSRLDPAYCQASANAHREYARGLTGTQRATERLMRDFNARGTLEGQQLIHIEGGEMGFLPYMNSKSKEARLWNARVDIGAERLLDALRTIIDIDGSSGLQLPSGWFPTDENAVAICGSNVPPAKVIETYQSHGTDFESSATTAACDLCLSARDKSLDPYYDGRHLVVSPFDNPDLKTPPSFSARRGEGPSSSKGVLVDLRGSAARLLASRDFGLVKNLEKLTSTEVDVDGEFVMDAVPKLPRTSDHLACMVVSACHYHQDSVAILHVYGVRLRYGLPDAEYCDTDDEVFAGAIPVASAALNVDEDGATESLSITAVIGGRRTAVELRAATQGSASDSDWSVLAHRGLDRLYAGITSALAPVDPNDASQRMPRKCKPWFPFLHKVVDPVVPDPGGCPADMHGVEMPGHEYNKGSGSLLALRVSRHEMRDAKMFADPAALTGQDPASVGASVPKVKLADLLARYDLSIDLGKEWTRKRTLNDWKQAVSSRQLGTSFSVDLQAGTVMSGSKIVGCMTSDGDPKDVGRKFWAVNLADALRTQAVDQLASATKVKSRWSMCVNRVLLKGDQRAGALALQAQLMPQRGAHQNSVSGRRNGQEAEYFTPFAPVCVVMAGCSAGSGNADSFLVAHIYGSAAEQWTKLPKRKEIDGLAEKPRRFGLNMADFHCTANTGSYVTTMFFKPQAQVLSDHLGSRLSVASSAHGGFETTTAFTPLGSSAAVEAYGYFPFYSSSWLDARMEPASPEVVKGSRVVKQASPLFLAFACVSYGVSGIGSSPAGCRLPSPEVLACSSPASGLDRLTGQPHVDSSGATEATRAIVLALHAPDAPASDGLGCAFAPTATPEFGTMPVRLLPSAMAHMQAGSLSTLFSTLGLAEQRPPQDVVVPASRVGASRPPWAPASDEVAWFAAATSSTDMLRRTRVPVAFKNSVAVDSLASKVTQLFGSGEQSGLGLEGAAVPCAAVATAQLAASEPRFQAQRPAVLTDSRPARQSHELLEAVGARMGGSGADDAMDLFVFTQVQAGSAGRAAAHAGRAWRKRARSTDSLASLAPSESAGSVASSRARGATHRIHALRDRHHHPRFALSRSSADAAALEEEEEDEEPVHEASGTPAQGTSGGGSEDVNEETNEDTGGDGSEDVNEEANEDTGGDGSGDVNEEANEDTGGDGSGDVNEEANEDTGGGGSEESGQAGSSTSALPSVAQFRTCWTATRAAEREVIDAKQSLQDAAEVLERATAALVAARRPSPELGVLQELRDAARRVAENAEHALGRPDGSVDPQSEEGQDAAAARTALTEAESRVQAREAVEADEVGQLEIAKTEAEGRVSSLAAEVEAAEARLDTAKAALDRAAAELQADRSDPEVARILTEHSEGLSRMGIELPPDADLDHAEERRQQLAATRSQQGVIWPLRAFEFGTLATKAPGQLNDVVSGRSRAPSQGFRTASSAKEVMAVLEGATVPSTDTRAVTLHKLSETSKALLRDLDAETIAEGRHESLRHAMEEHRHREAQRKHSGNVGAALKRAFGAADADPLLHNPGVISSVAGAVRNQVAGFFDPPPTDAQVLQEAVEQIEVDAAFGGERYQAATEGTKEDSTAVEESVVLWRDAWKQTAGAGAYAAFWLSAEDAAEVTRLSEQLLRRRLVGTATVEVPHAPHRIRVSRPRPPSPNPSGGPPVPAQDNGVGLGKYTPPGDDHDDGGGGSHKGHKKPTGKSDSGFKPWPSRKPAPRHVSGDITPIDKRMSDYPELVWPAPGPLGRPMTLPPVSPATGGSMWFRETRGGSAGNTAAGLESQAAAEHVLSASDVALSPDVQAN
ncbi:hypothetical protein FNF27_05396 [Cafeteria roenbergensis]|uniref:Uncharacterized protein n=1 Tax=Cafeteria roenbergensis TaxID=33653 RepID=A0A5A8E623_CAFRO|nr:hypothetical protein FNF27_05396 [Cafeteria roenbergensis]